MTNWPTTGIFQRKWRNQGKYHPDSGPFGAQREDPPARAMTGHDGPRRALDRRPKASRRIRGVAGCSINQRDRGHSLAKKVYNCILSWSGVIAAAAGGRLG